MILAYPKFSNIKFNIGCKLSRIETGVTIKTQVTKSTTIKKYDLMIVTISLLYIFSQIISDYDGACLIVQWFDYVLLISSSVRLD